MKVKRVGLFGLNPYFRKLPFHKNSMHLAGDNAHEALSGARGLGAVPDAVLNASSDRPVPSTNAVLGEILPHTLTSCRVAHPGKAGKRSTSLDRVASYLAITHLTYSVILNRHSPQSPVLSPHRPDCSLRDHICHIPSTIAPSGLLCKCNYLLRNFFAIFRSLNGYNAYPMRSLGIESGNAPPFISIKAITGGDVTWRLGSCST